MKSELETQDIEAISQKIIEKLKPLGEIPKNSTEKIRVSTVSYKGHDFIDVRVHYEDDNGEWRPTKKGIATPPEKVEELVSLIKKAQK